MFVLPFQVNQTEYSVFVAMGDDNIERIRAYDPMELVLAKLDEAFHGLRLKDVIIGYATDEDFKKITEMIHAGNPRDALKFLSRGFAFRPDRGDYDGPYLSAKRGDEPAQ